MEHYTDPEIAPGMVSSSPLKTASSISTVSPSQALASSVSTYLTKYVEVASGGRVKFQGSYGFGGINGVMGGWFRFRCETCKDNWNVKSDLFRNNTNPKELTDWVEQHKHICNNFSGNWVAGVNPKCDRCGWTWNQHAAAQPKFNSGTGKWEATTPAAHVQVIHVSPGKIINVEAMTPLYRGQTTGCRPCVICEELIPVASGSSLCDECFKAAKTVHETKSLTQKNVEGRMFRRKEGEQCELKVTNQPTSPDSLRLTTPVSKD